MQATATQAAHAGAACKQRMQEKRVQSTHHLNYDYITVSVREMTRVKKVKLRRKCGKVSW